MKNRLLKWVLRSNRRSITLGRTEEYRFDDRRGWKLIIESDDRELHIIAMTPAACMKQAESLLSRGLMQRLIRCSNTLVQGHDFDFSFLSIPVVFSISDFVSTGKAVLGHVKENGSGRPVTVFQCLKHPHVISSPSQ